MKTLPPTVSYAVLGFVCSLVVVSPVLVMSWQALDDINLTDHQAMSVIMRALTVKMLCWAGAVGVFSAWIGSRFGKSVCTAQRLRETAAAKDSFFSILGHDLRSPMSVLAGFLDILQDGYDRYDDSTRKQFIQRSHTAARRVCDLLEDILEWARLQRGAVPWQPEPCDLFALVDETIFVLDAAAQKKTITVQIDIPAQSVVYADPAMLKTVVRNLISNAIKFTQPGGTITVSSVPVGDYEEIAVADTGVGMSAEQLAKLFRIDVVFSTPGTAKEPGTGLGLVLCKEFVEKNKGTIRVESVEGQGSVFRLTIPKRNITRPQGFQQDTLHEAQGRQTLTVSENYCVEYDL